MATYVNDLRLKEIATGDEAGTWGTSTNTNLQLIGEALGYDTQDCFATDADATTTVADGASDPARAMYFKVTSSATLTATRTLTIAPNTVSRVMLIENATTGSQSIAISQGSGGNVTIASGQTKMVYLDGAGATATVVDALADLELGTITVANLTATTVDINGGTIDGVTIGGASAGAGTFTTLNATGGGALTGTWTDLGSVTTVDINGGTIDGVTIGGSSAGAGSFTTLTASGDVNFDSGTFFVDASADAVGIGTTSPANLLHVSGASAGALEMARFRLEGATNNPMLKIEADEANQTAGLDVSGSTATELTFSVAGTERVRIDGSGNFGIGTASPARPLDVNGAIRLANANGIEWGGSNYSIVGDTAGALIFNTAGSEAARFDGSGNLGIGTASPASKLSIASGDILLDNTRSIIFKDSGGVARGILQYFSDNSTYLDAPNGNTVFRNGTSNTEKMRITSAGDVGIGSNSPGFVTGSGLEIQRTTATATVRLEYTGSNAFELSAEQNTVTYNSVSSTPHVFEIGSSEKMRLDASGNLGIGESSPTSKLHINSGTADQGVLVESTDTRALIGFKDDTTTTNPLIGGAGNDLVVRTNNTEYMRIDASGNTTFDGPGFFKHVGTYSRTTASAANLFIFTDGQFYRSTSSARYKNSIEDASYGLSDVMSLRPVTYKGNNDGDTVYGGLVAEEVHDAGLSEFVQYDEQGRPDALAYGNMVSLCIKAIQEQQEIIEDLRARVAALEA